MAAPPGGPAWFAFMVPSMLISRVSGALRVLHMDAAPLGAEASERAAPGERESGAQAQTLT